MCQALERVDELIEGKDFLMKYAQLHYLVAEGLLLVIKFVDGFYYVPEQALLWVVRLRR